MRYPYFKIDAVIERAASQVMETLAPTLRRMDEITDYNQQKMMAAFNEAESVKAILRPPLVTATETGDVTLWMWCMLRHWERRTLWYAIILSAELMR